MSEIRVNLDGLNNDELDLIARLADTLRTIRGKEQARAHLRQLWAQLSAPVPPMSEEEIEKLVEEAMAEARQGL